MSFKIELGKVYKCNSALTNTASVNVVSGKVTIKGSNVVKYTENNEIIRPKPSQLVQTIDELEVGIHPMSSLPEWICFDGTGEVWTKNCIDLKYENNPKIISGGSIGSSDYNELENKPQINGIELTGNKTSADLGISIDESNLVHKNEVETITADKTFDCTIKGLLDESCKIDETTGNYDFSMVKPIWEISGKKENLEYNINKKITKSLPESQNSFALNIDSMKYKDINTISQGPYVMTIDKDYLSSSIESINTDLMNGKLEIGKKVSYSFNLKVNEKDETGSSVFNTNNVLQTSYITYADKFAVNMKMINPEENQSTEWELLYTQGSLKLKNSYLQLSTIDDNVPTTKWVNDKISEQLNTQIGNINTILDNINGEVI